MIGMIHFHLEAFLIVIDSYTGGLSMDLTIIIPVYNSTATIESCLLSIQQQQTDYTYEVVAVDDGSTDGSLALLHKLQQKYSWLKVLTQPNSKQAAARNLGLTVATGEYVAFIDIDDTLAQSYIEQMLQPLKENKRLKWMICGIRKKWTTEKEVIEAHTVFEQAAQLTQLSLVGRYLNRNQEMDAGLWNKVFSRKMIEQNHLKFQNRNFYEDMLFNLDYFLCLEGNEIQTTTTVLYTLNRELNSSTTTSFDPMMDQLTDHFYHLVQALLTKQFGQSAQLEKILATLNVRLTIHKIHYHFVTDATWKSRDTKRLVKQNIQLKSVFHYYDLDRRYQLSCIGLRLLPGFYQHYYLKKWQ